MIFAYGERFINNHILKIFTKTVIYDAFCDKIFTYNLRERIFAGYLGLKKEGSFTVFAAVVELF